MSATQYVMLFAERRIQVRLDALRFVCDRTVDQRAHITLPDPQLPLGSVIAHLRGAAGTAQGVGRFFGRHQSTVFLKCDVEGLKDVWPSRRPYRPHITLYDGRSRRLAELLYSRVAVLRPSFAFHIGDLQDENESKVPAGSRERLLTAALGDVPRASQRKSGIDPKARVCVAVMLLSVLCTRTGRGVE